MWPPISGAKSPDCPLCGHPPALMASSTQACCGNDDCRALMWDQTKTPAANLADETHVDLVRNVFTCPRCGAVSQHPTDKAEGYCGACHDWTGDPADVEHTNPPSPGA